MIVVEGRACVSIPPAARLAAHRVPGEQVVPEQSPDLLPYLAALPDPRDPRGLRHDLVGVLAVAVLGDTTLRIEHVGSTSVPGLAAKPIIDILLAVPDSPDEPSYVPAMEAAWYRLTIREPAGSNIDCSRVRTRTSTRHAPSHHRRRR
jgi:hypothetical protein